MITMTTAVLATALALTTAGCAGTDLGAVAPCDLLTPGQLGDAGLGAGRPADTGPVRSCSWTPEGGLPGEQTLLMVIPGAALDEFRTLPLATGSGDFADDEIGGRPALRRSGPGCMTVVDVGSGLLAMVGSEDCGRQRPMVERAMENL